MADRAPGGVRPRLAHDDVDQVEHATGLEAADIEWFFAHYIDPAQRTVTELSGGWTFGLGPVPVYTELGVGIADTWRDTYITGFIGPASR